MHIADFQHAVMLWMEQCFGRATDGMKTPIRNFRFYEEATELVQAGGMTREEAHRQVDYTFDRPPGKAAQELGGVLVTLAAWAGTHGLQMSEHGPAELMRIDTPEMIAKICAKQASKPGEGGPPRPSSDPVPDGVRPLRHAPSHLVTRAHRVLRMLEANETVPALRVIELLRDMVDALTDGVEGGK